MAKKLAVLAVNPVNGFGLFQYLESFYENKIPYKVFAVATDKCIRTNSGIALEADDVVANLKGRADEFDGIVFACGDAMPIFAQHATEAYNVDLMEVIKEFAGKDKLIIGHCAAALLFDFAGISEGRKVAVHPLAKPAITKGKPTDEAIAIDGNFYTAQTEHTISALMPELLGALK